MGGLATIICASIILVKQVFTVVLRPIILDITQAYVKMISSVSKQKELNLLLRMAFLFVRSMVKKGGRKIWDLASLART
ncbi:MAG: hypothetical protein JSW62_01415 [Thermoplasmatales archaeon]|nr:MAG: hypothetical protein JSW62_01415 [Thermoplasmatales archaeon]